MALTQDQNDHCSIGESINNKSFNDDEESTYDDNLERTHRNSADSSSSERTLVFSYLDFQDAIRSSIYDKPEVRTCDCATKPNDKISNETSQISQNEPQQEQSQSSPPPQNKHEVIVIFILASIISYAVGRFGFTYVWLPIILYLFIMWYNNLAKDHEERVRWEAKREISMKLNRDDGESVEWLNHLLQQIWRTFDTSLLIGLRDTIEDTMARSAPALVSAADIEALEIGLIAPRIDSIKILSRCENQDDEDVLIGEATFSFRARPSTMTCHDTPPRILAWIKTGISALIPIRVELTGFKASIHFEIKLTGTPPFISTGKFRFLELPICETSVMPLIPMNIVQFPVIKQFICSALQTVLEQFTFPNYIDLDLKELLMGSELDTQAIGIMRVDIFEAGNLTHVDVAGDNDPYVISSLDPPHYTHTHFTTRVIEDCAKPVWRETFFHKVPELDIIDKFKLKVMDWDRFTSDDHIGSIWINIKDAIGDGKHEKLIHDGWEKIRLNQSDEETQGDLRFRLEYFPKLPNKVEATPEQTSGIFALTIHQAMGLRITTAPYIEESIITMSDNPYNTYFPNPYAVVYLNDSRVFRTRAKLNNVAPFWNASTEQFVRDWTSATVRIVIKDQKDLEYDPVIGMVTLSMKEIFEQKEKEKTKKEVTKWYPLRHGIGCGKVRLSFLFKNISMVLPPQEKGYDVGTLFVHSISAEELGCGRGVYLTLTIRNTEIEQETKVSSSLSWLENSEKPMEFAVLRRYRTSLMITVNRKGLFGIYYTVGTAEYWLRDIVDLHETEVEIPIFKILPKCFPASNSTDMVESSQNMNETTNFDDIDVPRCESPFSDKEDSVGTLQDSNLISQEKMSNKSVINSTDIIPPEDVGESSQNPQIEKESGKEVVNEQDSPKSDTGDEISSDTKPLNNVKDNEHEESTNSYQPPPKSTEVPSEQPVLNTEETLTSNPLTEQSIISSLEKETPSEILPNVSQVSPAATKNITSDISNELSASVGEIKGFLKFKVYFRPGLSLAHEKDVERSLTGANVNILCQKGPFEQSQDTNINGERSIPSGKSETKPGQEKRINSLHRRRTMRQLQWAKDLVKAKVVSMSGKREWEDEEIIEHEV